MAGVGDVKEVDFIGFSRCVEGKCGFFSGRFTLFFACDRRVFRKIYGVLLIG
jgi:hypothetical protein